MKTIEAKIVFIKCSERGLQTFARLLWVTKLVTLYLHCNRLRSMIVTYSVLIF